MHTTRIIEAYLEGSLEKDLAEEIRIKAENDIEWADLIRLHKEINESICDDELEKLRITLKQISSDKHIGDDKIIIPIRRILQIAAVCLFLLITISAARKWFFVESTDAKVFKKYYARYEPDVITRSGKIVRNSLENAQFLYQTGNFVQSAEILSDVISKDRKNYMAWFYLGLVKMELKQTSEATRDFLKIPSDWKSPYLIHRNWYLSLCLIKTGHEKEAGSILMRLSASNKFYSARARDLLKELSI
jgi:tetratricopeptide (TPR) repeat protein